MKSDRILWASTVKHTVELSELEIYLALHGLHTLETAFSREPEYRELIIGLQTRLRAITNEQPNEQKREPKE